MQEKKAAKKEKDKLKIKTINVEGQEKEIELSYEPLKANQYITKIGQEWYIVTETWRKLKCQ